MRSHPQQTRDQSAHDSQRPSQGVYVAEIERLVSDILSTWETNRIEYYDQMEAEKELKHSELEERLTVIATLWVSMLALSCQA